MEDDGGRFILKRLKVDCDNVITEPMHSKEKRIFSFYRSMVNGYYV